MERISFYDQIDRNKRNSILLILLIFAVLLVFSWVIAQIYDPGATFIIMIFGIIISLIYTWGTYYYSDRIVISTVNARPAEGPEYRHLQNMVEGLSLAAGTPKPKVYVMQSPDINAFATGRNPENSAVCVTTGALQKLNDSEMEGVLAHEMTHVRNYDIRFITLVTVMVGIISIVSELFLRSMWYSGGGGRRDKGGGLILLIGIILAILAPIAVKLVQFAISRRREFVADAGSVELTRYPGGLVSALDKIKNEHIAGKSTKVNEAIAPLFFANPLENRFVNLFSTHPPIDERIKILRAM